MHIDVWQDPPKTFATDRGMWSQDNLEIFMRAGTEKIGIQPKATATALVGQRDLQSLSNRRAAIEPGIAHLKTRGLGKSRMKSDLGDIISRRTILRYRTISLIY